MHIKYEWERLCAEGPAVNDRNLITTLVLYNKCQEQKKKEREGESEKVRCTSNSINELTTKR